VTRPGRGGRRQIGRLLVFYSDLAGNITQHHGLRSWRSSTPASTSTAASPTPRPTPCELLDANRRPLPAVNAFRAGEEADLSWPEPRLIVEIDGPQFHRDKLHDAHKTATWTAAGWTVRRIDSDDVFLNPDRLLALATLDLRLGVGPPQVSR
jgi:hypothetical protein